MANHSYQRQTNGTTDVPYSIDYVWLAAQFESLNERLNSLESAITGMEQAMASGIEGGGPPTSREYYSVAEFASLVGRNEYTVREWCRLERIHAEKCDSGRGDAKNWKIAAVELERYQNHGLLPVTYLR